MSFIVRITFCLQRFQHRLDHTGGQAWAGGVDQHSWQMDCLTDQSMVCMGCMRCGYNSGKFFRLILLRGAWSAEQTSSLPGIRAGRQTDEGWGSSVLGCSLGSVDEVRDRKTVATLSIHVGQHVPAAPRTLWWHEAAPSLNCCYTQVARRRDTSAPSCPSAHVSTKTFHLCTTSVEIFQNICILYCRIKYHAIKYKTVFISSTFTVRGCWQNGRLYKMSLFWAPEFWEYSSGYSLVYTRSALDNNGVKITHPAIFSLGRR